MLWTLNALQTGRADVARGFLSNYPAEAETDGILGRHAIYPWELETLANELLATEKSIYRSFNHRDWNSIANLVNQLRATVNAEYATRGEKPNILAEMGRIAALQFPWQRGYVGAPQLYRNAFIYGQGECATFLREATNISPSDMTLVGFSLLAVFFAQPAIRPATDMRLIHEFGISVETLHHTLDRIAQPIEDLRLEATTQRDVSEATAYKPSILRKFPCLRVGHRRRVLVSPLPELIMDRVTNGLFYDVIGGGGPVRDEIGRRFEAYCVDLLGQMLTEASFLPEARYRTPRGLVATPDIRMRDDGGEVQLVIECKASRMNVAARFGETPEQERGYGEIAKGVMQLWRYFAHCGQGVASDRLASDAGGMILTLDEWFAGRSAMIPQIVARANELADNSPHCIPMAYRRPVAFCTISELESVLVTATSASLREAVQTGSGDRVGWLFSIVHDETLANKTIPKEYPFLEALGDILPWYARLDELREGEGDS